MSKTAREHYLDAIELKGRIISGKSNQSLVQAWAAVARKCAIAQNAFWAEQGTRIHGRSQQSFLSNLDRLHWAATAQVETLSKEAA